METERRRRGSAGGKRVKALTAEEEARRREVLKDKLREKLELEKRALRVVERLLEDSVTDEFLIDCARFITSANYKDAVEERTLVKLCGYPICPNKLDKVLKQKYKISTKTNKVYDITERKYFCSNFCYKASKHFELQISDKPLWLRQHESPAEIRLMKKGDGGSSGEEVMLSERRLQEKDIEDPLAAQPEDHRGCDLGHSDSGDIEQEQDFISSVVSQREGPRVHWDNLPKHGNEVENSIRQRGRKLREDEICTEKQFLSVNTEQLKGEVSEEKTLSEEPSVEEASAKFNLCSLSETPAAPLPFDSALFTSPTCKDSNLSTANNHFPSSTPINVNPDNSNEDLTRLNITQVGVSKRGAAGLRNLLKKHSSEAKTDSIQLNLLKGLERTLKDWCTEATLVFLYGTDHSGSPFADARGEKEEELDEDDLDDEDVQEIDVEVLKRPSARVPDYETLRKDTQQLELRVRDFYKGTLILPEEVGEKTGDEVPAQDQSMKDPVLPLIDSCAQHVIQKRITVEKLNSCLKNFIGSLHLTMSDVSTDLNNLVRTFKFTNMNIIHKTPEWTLIAIVLLHLLSEVSPVVREALDMPASLEYLNTLTKELGLREQDLLDLVRVFKTPSH